MGEMGQAEAWYFGFLRDLFHFSSLESLLVFLQAFFACFPSFSPNSVVTLGVLTVRVEDGCLIEVLTSCPANSLLFTVHSFTSRSSKCMLAESGGREWVLFETALSLWCRAYSWAW